MHYAFWNVTQIVVAFLIAGFLIYRIIKKGIKLF